MLVITTRTTPADVAYQLMKQEVRAMHARDLIEAVATALQWDKDDPATKAKVYTSINLDPRLAFLGKGVWGIRDWSATDTEAATAMPDLLPGEGSYQPKAGDYLWDDDEDDDEDEEEQQPASDEEPEEPIYG